ncbi:tail protein [Pseudoalteromonas luteoviolacea CPMOR-1]|uniref:Tail protein n=1 Tax=Pseudoalteromonas luteoviolacea CPMOR-1 TaxID=1365248 RepID=A0A167GZS5_9GAMM|nr:phage tail protein I [Pseudoalteromonas luteoviolacea]KZN57479.1 tail protein [Pseudoalteromonas luteoviolacea CPMOR-1]
MSEQLLPSNATQQEKALEQVSARIDDVPVQVCDLWSPERCPAHLLPWLAHALSVDEWDSTWHESIQRTVIAESVPTHRIKGTAGAVKRALTALNAHIELEEWWQNGGVPHTAKLIALVRNNLNQTGDSLLTPELQAQLWRIVAAIKPARSHIDFNVGVQMDQHISIASATTSCNVQRMDFTGGPDNTLYASSHVVQSATSNIANSRAELTGAPDNALHTSSHVIQSAHSNVANSRAKLTGSPDHTLHTSSQVIQSALSSTVNSRREFISSPDNALHTGSHTLQSAASNIVNARTPFTCAPDNTLHTCTHVITSSINTKCIQTNRMVCQ